MHIENVPAATKYWDYDKLLSIISKLHRYNISHFEVEMLNQTFK